MQYHILGITILGAALSLPTYGLGLQGEKENKAQPDKKVQGKGDHQAHHAMLEKCAKACNDCQRICDACARHCTHLVAEGKKEHVKTLRTCQDCASFCATAAQIVSRGGPFADLICKGCAEACNRCGKACKEHSDDMMQKCAEECARCEKACQEMVQHAGHLEKGTKTAKPMPEAPDR